MESNVVVFHPDHDAQAAVTVKVEPAASTNGSTASTAPTNDRWTSSSGKKLQPYEVLTVKEKNAILLSLIISMFLAAVDQNIVVVALPKITADLDGFNYLAWVISAYMLTASSTMALYGRFSDVYGRKLVYLFAVGVFCIGSAVSGAANSIWVLIGGRAIQGIGGGGLMSLAMIIIGDIVPPDQRPKYMSGMSSIFGIASIVAPLLGGVLTDQASWRWVFLINLPLGILAFVSSAVAMGRFQVPAQNLPLDVMGSLFIASATVCIVLFVTWGGQDQGYPWSSWIIILLILLSIVLLAAFVWQEFRHPLPILNLQLFKQSNFGLIMFMMFFSGITMLGAFAYLPVYYIDGRGDSAVLAGLKLIPFVLGFMIAAGASGAYLMKTGKFMGLLPLGTAIYTIGIGLLILLQWDTNFGIIFVYLIIGGWGLGIIFPVSTILVQNSVPVPDMANALSAYTFFQSMGGALGVAILGSVLNAQLATQTAGGPAAGQDPTAWYQQATVRALHIVFAAAVAPSAVAFLSSLFLKNIPINLKREEEAMAAAAAAAGTGTATTDKAVEMAGTANGDKAANGAHANGNGAAKVEGNGNASTNGNAPH